MVWLTIVVVLAIVTLLWYKAIKPLSYWKKRGVPHIKGIPLIGNSKMLFFPKKPFMDYILEIYNEFPNERYFGVHQFLKPALYIRDVDLIKRITVKNFEQFFDHNNVTPEDVEPLIGKNLFHLKGERWRQMRVTLTPSFTSSKMKIMFTLVSECAQNFTEYFEKQEGNIFSVELKDTFTRFANDVIASVAFGLKCDSLECGSNQFYMVGKTGINFNKVRLYQLILSNISSYLAKLVSLLPITIIPTSASNFFRNIIKETVIQREREGLVRPDMIHLLMQARKRNPIHEDSGKTDKQNVPESIFVDRKNPKNLELTYEDITAQAFAFFVGGFETTTTAMSFMGYELAVNQEIQKRLQNEIDETLKECDGKLTFDAIQKMKYMNMVVAETLRKWPPVFLTDRLCKKDYTVKPVKANEKPLLIEKGTAVLIPIIAIQRDPKYFSNPDVFDPERFSDENKSTIEPYSYLPFGSGPRNCIASRFALMENKILFFYLLSKFDIVETEKTRVPLKLEKTIFTLIPAKGIWFGLRRRKFRY